MASRFYFPASQAAPVTPPSPGAEWEHNNGVTRALLKDADSSALATTAYTPDAADDITDKDAMHRQYVSQFRLKAQTISGNVKAQFQCLEAGGNNNLTITIVVKVISEDGSTTRATLLAITRDGTEANTALRNLIFASAALSSYTCVDGDRLLVEVGLAGSSGPAAGGVQGHNGSIRWGCSASSGDLPEDDADTSTTKRPWIEFSNTLTFDDFPITAGPGSFTETGAAATLLRGYYLSADPGSYALSGAAASTTRGYLASADPGSYAEAGVASTPTATRTVGVAAGSYAEAGVDAAALIGYLVDALVGSYAEAGVDADLTYQSNAPHLDADPGAFDVAGTDATTVPTRLLVVDAAAFAMSGATASALAERLASLDPATFAVGGVAAIVGRELGIDAAVGSYALSGAVATALRDALLDLVAAAITIAAPEATAGAARALTLSPSVYVLTGSASTIVFIAIESAGGFTIVGAPAGLIKFPSESSIYRRDALRATIGKEG